MFDQGLHFPCFALFLDAEYALLLKKSDKDTERYERVGLARFLERTYNDQIAVEAVTRAFGETWGVVGTKQKRTTVVVI